jgi:hypothetical protein
MELLQKASTVIRDELERMTGGSTLYFFFEI